MHGKLFVLGLTRNVSGTGPSSQRQTRGTWSRVHPSPNSMCWCLLSREFRISVDRFWAPWSPSRPCAVRVVLHKRPNDIGGGCQTNQLTDAKNTNGWAIRPPYAGCGMNWCSKCCCTGSSVLKATACLETQRRLCR